MEMEIKTAYVKGLDGTYRPVLWNLPPEIAIPNLLEEDESGVNGSDTNREERQNSTMKDVMFAEGLTSIELKHFYILIKGTTVVPKTPEDVEDFVGRLIHGRIPREILIKNLENDKLIDWNRVVLWGGCRDRSLIEMFYQVKPSDHWKGRIKEVILDPLRMAPSTSTDLEGSNYTCQACRKQCWDLSSLVNHLLRKIRDVTYMCRHCGFMKFTNTCALIYHVMDDAYIGPRFEYCVVCSSYFGSLESHLSGLRKYVDSWRGECPRCPFVAYSKCSLNLHLGSHIKPLPYICPECGEFFLEKSDLDKHEEEVCFIYCKYRFYFCPACYLMVSEEEHFVCHISGSHYKRNLQCLICKQLTGSQSEFRNHQAALHFDSSSTYMVVQNCDLCPDKSFRGVSFLKHLSVHKSDIQCSFMLYWCKCEFYTRHKETFIKHVRSKSCTPSAFRRPQVLKICAKCNDVKSYTNTELTFVCEDCDLKNLNVKNSLFYYCEMCQLVIKYSWDSVFDHFFSCHERFDPFAVGFKVSAITANTDMIREGKRFNMKNISYTTCQDVFRIAIGGSVSESNAAQETPDSLSERLAGTNLQGNPKEMVLGIRVKPPESINASLLKESMVKPTVSITPKRPALPNEPAPSRWVSNNSVAPQVVFFCKKCGFTTCLKEDMSEHMVKKHNESFLLCETCDEEFVNNTERLEHMRSFHGYREKSCEVVEVGKESEGEEETEEETGRDEANDGTSSNPVVTDDMDYDAIMRMIN